MNKSTLPIVPVEAPPVNVTNAPLGNALKAAEYLRHFINPDQMSVIVNHARRSEERQFFRDKLCELAGVVASMPGPYGTQGQGEKAIAWLHYFNSGGDWYITEKNTEDPGEPGQHQAHGLACPFGDEGERGYISIAELIANGVELDLHWTPASLAAIKAEREGRRSPPLPAAEAAAVDEFNAYDRMNTPGLKPADPIASWDKPKELYQRNDRSWIGCTWQFLEDMLGVVPPVYGPTNHGFGLLFGVGEPWNHTPGGEEVLLWFRNIPGPACRLATRTEINAEVKGGK